MKILLTLLTLLSLVVLAGCTATQAPVNTSTGITETVNTNDVAEVEETISNSNEAIDVAENTNSDETTEEVDTFDWLTYENEEYGLGFNYPDYFYTNYTSQVKLPLGRTLLQDVPKERTEDVLGSTYDELLAEKEEIEQAKIDGLRYRKLSFGAVAKVTVTVEEGGGIVKKYTWYDDDYRYTMSFVFPVSSDMEADFRVAYPDTERVNEFINEVINGNSPEKYQIWFDEFDDIMNTFYQV